MQLPSRALFLTVATHGLAYSEEPHPVAPPVQASRTQQADLIREEVEKRGVGEHSRVTVTLRDGSQVKGFIRQIDATSFQVTDPKSGRTSTIAYDTVEHVKSGGMSRGVKTAIWAAVAGGMAGVVILLIGASWHGN